MNNMNGMDPSAMYYAAAGMGGMDGMSGGGVGGAMDTSMTTMLGDGMLDGFEGMPMTLDMTGLDDNLDDTFGSVGRGIPSSTGPGDEAGGVMQSPMDNSMTGAGAGPLPTGFGAHSSLGGGSTLTEFTKRRNWSQRVVEELKDFLHILTPDGRIVYISPSSKSLTGYSPEDLVGHFIVDYIHPDDSGIFVRDFNESIATSHPLRFFYRFRKQDGTYTIFESHGHPHLTIEGPAYGPANSAGFCRGFFMMARPYPTKNAALLDSFLEHKIENERLMKRIADLKREELEDAEDVRRHILKKQEGRSDVTPSEETDTVGGSMNTPSRQQQAQQQSQSQPQSQSQAQQTQSQSQSQQQAGAAAGSAPLADADARAMPPPAKPSLVNNTALTRQNLEDANAGLQPDSINDKMARFEATTHSETIEMLTGLRYQDGERSQGISTGDQSPALIRGDAGIAIPVDKDGRAGDKKKKIKVADEFVCTDCGTLDSPEWRKGPSGPKTLCNACGLRWAKKEKKRTGTSNGGGGGNSGPLSAHGMGQGTENSG